MKLRMAYSIRKRLIIALPWVTFCAVACFCDVVLRLDCPVLYFVLGALGMFVTSFLALGRAPQ